MKALGPALVACLVLASACGGSRGPDPSPPTSGAGAAPLPGECMPMAPESSACNQGNGRACTAMGNRIWDEMPLSQDEQRRRHPCLFAALDRACALADTRGCRRAADFAGLARTPQHEGYAKRACMLDAVSCEELADFYAPPPRGRRTDPAAYEAALVRGCDLGASRACIALARAHAAGGVLAPDPLRSTRLWEAGCLVAAEPVSACLDLRRALAAGRAAQRDALDELPLLSIFGEAVPSSGPPAPTSGGGGICEIDPSACPRPQATGVVVPPDPGGRYDRTLGAMDGACARGELPACLRRAELELTRFTHSVSSDERSQGAPPRFDAEQELSRLCGLGVGEACREVAVRPRTPPDARATLLGRGCGGGSARACAMLAVDIRAADRAHARRAEVADLFSRACRAR